MIFDLADAAQRFQDLVRDAGIWGPIVLALSFVVGAVVVAPRPLLCVASGLALGAWGFPLALGAATLGACVAFALGRSWLKPHANRVVARSRHLSAICRAIEREGFRAVLLLRLGPAVPSSLQSYMFAATSLPFRPYLIGTVVGIAPGIAAQVAAGALGQAAFRSDWGAVQTALLSVACLAFAAAILFIGREARRQLRLDEAGAVSGGAPAAV